MIKKILVLVASLGLLVTGICFALTQEGSISMTGTPEAVLVLHVLPTTIDWGIFPPGALLCTTGETKTGFTQLPLAFPYIDIEGSNVHAKLSIKGSDAIAANGTWTLSGAPGTDTFSLSYNFHNTNWVEGITTLYQDILGYGEDVPPVASTRNLDLAFSAPTLSTGVGLPYTFGITILATAL